LLSGILSGALPGGILIACLALGNVWCARLCPLGGLQDFLIAGRVVMDRMLRRRNRAGDLPAIPARRALLTGLLGVALALLGRRTGQARVGTAPLRPPGARAEDEFTGLCIRCGNCSSVCPTRIILPDPGHAGVAGLLAPLLRYDGAGYCRENCNACTQACPSGALTALDRDAKQRYIIGEALVDADRCLLVLGRKECDACAIACPFGAVTVAWDEMQYLAYPLVDYQRCNGCGACQIACPTEPVKAIVVWPSLPDPTGGDDRGLPRYLSPRA
jgi:ferredoxin-type protein NapF